MSENRLWVSYEAEDARTKHWLMSRQIFAVFLGRSRTETLANGKQCGVILAELTPFKVKIFPEPVKISLRRLTVKLLRSRLLLRIESNSATFSIFIARKKISRNYGKSKMDKRISSRNNVTIRAANPAKWSSKTPVLIIHWTCRDSREKISR